VSIGLVLLVGLLAVAYDRSEFLFLDEIEIGMTGIGKTIVEDDTISEFAVEVIGIIDRNGDLGDFIAIRVSGAAIGRAGGVAQGMSGSPVYIDGKLIGALSRAGGWSKDLTPIALVTPIEPMLAVLDDAASAFAEPNEAAVLKDLAFVELDSPPSSELLAVLPDALFSYPVTTPLVAHGMSERAREVLMDGFQRPETDLLLIDDVLSVPFGPGAVGLSSLGLSLLPASGEGLGGSIDPETLEPGSSIGAAFAVGDMTIGSLGTLTYRDGDALIGYGHRFVNNGPSSFAMTTVSIIDTMKSFEASYKFGTLADTIGTVLEDRYAAIGGRMDVPFDGIDLTLDVVDLDSPRESAYAVELVDEPRMMSELLLSTGFDAIDRTLDRIGQGTVTVTYVVDGEGMPKPLARRDTFMSAIDIAVYPPLQLAAIVGSLQYNAFADPEITSIAATIEITDKIQGIWINNLQIDRLTYAAGDTIRFRVSLQTFQGEAFIREGEIRIPQELLTERIELRAYGGPRYLESGETPDVFESLSDLIDAIAGFPSYETLTVELFAVDPFSVKSDALVGITEIEFDFPGFVLYGEREAFAIILPPSNAVTEDEETDW